MAKTVEQMIDTAKQVIKNESLLKLAKWLIAEIDKANGEIVRFQNALGRDPASAFSSPAATAMQAAATIAVYPGILAYIEKPVSGMTIEEVGSMLREACMNRSLNPSFWSGPTAAAMEVYITSAHAQVARECAYIINCRG